MVLVSHTRSESRSSVGRPSFRKPQPRNRLSRSRFLILRACQLVSVVDASYSNSFAGIARVDSTRPNFIGYSQ